MYKINLINKARFNAIQPDNGISLFYSHWDPNDCDTNISEWQCTGDKDFVQSAEEWIKWREY